MSNVLISFPLSGPQEIGGPVEETLPLELKIR